MAVTTPTVAQIRDQIISDIEGRIGVTVPILPKAFVRVLAIALAGALSLLYRFATWVYRQIFPQTADAEALVRIGGQYGLSRTPAVRTVATATATGIDATVIPAGTLWTLAGLMYEQTADATIAAGSATIILECTAPGSDGNPTAGDDFTIVTPQADVDSTAAYDATTTEGEDQEAIEDFRTRVVARIQNQPQGGAAADYVGWAREVAGIVKAFAFHTGDGQVTVYPLQAITGVDRIPAAAKITEVEDYVGAEERRPLCANVFGAAMTELAVDIEITDLDPSDAATKAEIQAAIEAYLYAAYPRQYTDEVGATDVVAVAAIWAAIVASSATASAVDMLVDGNPATAYTLDEDEIVALGVLTWV